MTFGVYSVRDVKTGFQNLILQANDPIAIRSFQSSVMNADGVLLTHAQDFALYKVGMFDSETGRVTADNIPVLMVEAASILAARSDD